jgi:hypothetical protein
MKNVIDTLYKSYMLKDAVRSGLKFVRENLNDVEWDRDYWLHKMGLSSYTPARDTFGAIGIFALGAAVGGLAALAFAPKSGEQLRAEVKDKASQWVNKAQAAAEDLHITESNSPTARM